MNIKTKKKNYNGVVRLETSGEIKEVILKEDFLKPKEALVEVCFRGENSSGIIELNPKELELIFKEVEPRLKILKGIKVMKFKK